jgi:hypothetical protein
MQAIRHLNVSLCLGNLSGGIEHRVPVEEGTVSSDHLTGSRVSISELAERRESDNRFASEVEIR